MEGGENSIHWVRVSSQRSDGISSVMSEVSLVPPKTAKLCDVVLSGESDGVMEAVRPPEGKGSEGTVVS
jgi:hypothetical protein